MRSIAYSRASFGYIRYGCKPVNLTTAPFPGAVPQSPALGTKGEHGEGSVFPPHTHNVAAEVFRVAVPRTLFHRGVTVLREQIPESDCTQVAQILGRFRWHLTLTLGDVIHITVSIFVSNTGSISSNPFFLGQFEQPFLMASLADAPSEKACDASLY